MLLVVSPRAELRAMVVRLVPPQIPVFEADGVEQARALLPVLPNGADCVILDAKSPESAVDVLKELRVALPPPAPPMLVLLDASTPEASVTRATNAHERALYMTGESVARRVGRAFDLRLPG